MNSEEKQVLHGLYYYREIVGEDFLVSSDEIVWLTRTKLPNTRNWRKQDGSLHGAQEKTENYLAAIGATSARAERPLSYLQQTDFIDYTKVARETPSFGNRQGCRLGRGTKYFFGTAQCLL